MRIKKLTFDNCWEIKRSKFTKSRSYVISLDVNILLLPTAIVSLFVIGLLVNFFFLVKIIVFKTEFDSANSEQFQSYRSLLSIIRSQTQGP